MIITFFDEAINHKNDGLYSVFNETFLAELSSQGFLLKKTITYKLSVNNYERNLICPLIRTESGNVTVIWPAFKLPFRKYPAYVYLYAVILYLSSDLSMRKVCTKVRKTFGIDGFCHSTLSRTLKKLSLEAEKLEDIANPQSNTASNSIEANPRSERQNSFIRKHFSATRNEAHQKLQIILTSILNLSQTIPLSNQLNMRFYKKYAVFLL